MGKVICWCKLWAFLVLWAVTALFPKELLAIDIIKAGESINGSTQMLVSAQQKFVLGIFNPKDPKFQYLGIWYNNIPQTVVWVANRDKPLVNSSARLTFNGGNLILWSKRDEILWSSSTSALMEEPVTQLLDNGNLVIRGSGSANYVWQSFDYPTDTLLPSMKLGWDSETGLNRTLKSWRNQNDPSSGEFSFGIQMGGLPQLILHKGPVIRYRTGPWYNGRFSGSDPLGDTAVYSTKFDYSADEVIYSYEARSSLVIRFELNSIGTLQILYWDDDEKYWHPVYAVPKGRCDEYGHCGNFGFCNSLTEECDCLAGFEPKSPEDWGNHTWSDGCVRSDNREICGYVEGFKAYGSVKLPDSSGNLVNVYTSIEECDKACLLNCSCLAYGTMELSSGGYGCLIWVSKLIDVVYLYENGQDLYVREGLLKLDSGNSDDSGKRNLIVGLTVSVALLIGVLVIVLMFKRWRRRKVEGEIQSQENDQLEMPLYDFTEIEVATNNFCSSNKIGEGGFGPVYKGRLPNGQEIAVKKLAEGSSQGQREFKNEVLLISKLQHRNLVKLLGFCLHKEATLLVYEYMPNKSLDYFLFDDKKRSLLNWKKRLDIIIGIARGLLYLHRDSRLIIIHRDLKVSNILLDNNMNPKISDFGMARMFAEDQTITRTKRVVGTYGYMSPEYIMDGYFSTKSDIFSFGVILLEIVSGKKNRGFFHREHHLNLFGLAWTLWEEGNGLELMDETLKDEFQNSEALRCIQVGLLCVQENPDERPTMWSVLSMLESENMLLPHPKQPGFYTGRDVSKIQKLPNEIPTSNKVTITLSQGR